MDRTNITKYIQDPSQKREVTVSMRAGENLRLQFPDGILRVSFRNNRPPVNA